MSETDNDEELPDAEFDEEAEEATESVDADPAESSDRGKQKAKGGGTSIAWLALFLALIGVAGLGYLSLEKMREESAANANSEAISELRNQLSSTGDSLGPLSDRIDELRSADSRSNSAISALRNDLDRRAELFDSLPPRMSGIERSVAALQGVSIDARNTYLVAEAEYYMQIANAQLQLAGNPYLASLALGQADDRLLQLADPALTGVRRAIANELAALEVMEKPDIAGVTLTLGSLAGVVNALPMRSTTSQAEDTIVDDEGEPGMASRSWQAIKDAASSLVRVTPPDSDQVAMITPQFMDMARANLALQLQAARLALLRGEQEIFEQSIADADAWLELYFDTHSEPVISMRRTLLEINDEYSSVAAPDISTSLRLLRQYKALNEPGTALPANTAAPVDTVDETEVPAEPDAVSEPDA